MFLQDMADYLTSQGGWVQAGDLFVGQSPPSPDHVTTIYDPPGAPTVHAMNPLPGKAVLARPTLQVVVRGEKFGYVTARAVAQKAFLLLDGLPARAINGQRYCWGEALQSEPGLIGRDEEGRPLIGCNYRIHKDLDSTS